MKEENKIGLVLGGGGAKGLAHIGVIEVLEENKIPIDLIVGTSVGALIGGMYATTKNIQDVKDAFLSIKKHQIWSLLWSISVSGGFIDTEKIQRFIEKNISGVGFDSLKIKFASVATDIKKNETVVIREGEVALAIIASLSFPLIFKPLPWKDKLLVDGGVVSPLPVAVAKEMGADKVIAVSLKNHIALGNGNENSISHIAEDVIGIMSSNISKYEEKSADIVINPQISMRGFVGLRDFLRVEEFVAEGRKAAEKILPEIDKKLKNHHT